MSKLTYDFNIIIHITSYGKLLLTMITIKEILVSLDFFMYCLYAFFEGSYYLLIITHISHMK